MRLLQLYLKDYRVLRQLQLQFSDRTQRDSTYTLSFLVGVNGSGKSTVLRSLVEILRKLEQKAPISHEFRLEYMVGQGGDEQRHIVVENQLEDGHCVLRTLENEVPTEFSAQYHLPDRVVIFTTGSEKEWEEQATSSKNDDEGQGMAHVEQLGLTPLQLAIQELPGRPLISMKENQEAPEQTNLEVRDERFLLIRSEHLPILTLCGLLAHLASQERLLDDVLQEMKIKYIRGFSLKIRMNKGTTSPEDQEIVERLKAVASRALQMGTDYTLVFDLMDSDESEQSRSQTKKILQAAGADHATIAEEARGLFLFELLTQMARSNGGNPAILREVNIFLERISEKDVQTREETRSPMLLLDWLSDGERSFLGRMCLFSLLGGTESLILLDEPEVHFNDYWKRQIVYLIDKVLQGQPSHALITTHSSITLTDAPSEQIVVLDRTGVYTSDTFRPGIRTYATDPSDIIVSVFGAPQAAGRQSVEQVQNALMIRDQGKRRVELERLLKIVGPGFWRYRIRRELLAIGE